MRVECGVAIREVEPLMGAAALLARERARARSAEPAGAGRRAAAAARRRRGLRPAWRHSASRLSSVSRGGGPDAALARVRAASRASTGSSSAARAARAPNTKHSLSEFDASRLAPCKPGAGTLADREQAGQARPRRRGRRRSRPSCSGRRGRPGPARARGRCPPVGARRRRSGTGLGRRARMSRPTEAAPLSTITRWTARATSSRGASSSTNRSPCESSRWAPSPRTASVTRNPSAPLPPTTAVGWNCMNSRSARLAPARSASSRPEPVAPTGLVVRDHSAAAPPVASTVAGAVSVAPSSVRTPTQRPRSTSSATTRRSSRPRCAGPRRHAPTAGGSIRRPVAAPPACTIRRALWPPSSPSASRPRRSASKLTPSAARSSTAAGASSGQHSAAD